MKKTLIFALTLLLCTSAITKAQIVESRRVAANALWETYGRNANNPSQMPAAVPLSVGNDIDQMVIAPNYNDLKTALTTLLNNNGGVLRFNNTAPTTINFNNVIELSPTFQNRDKVRTIIIQGENITFDGMNTSSIFLVRGSVQLVIQDATFKNANFKGESQANLNSIFRTGGGAIEVVQSGPFFSSLRVRNCQFMDNTVSHFQGIGENQNGAGIRFNYGTSGEVFGCTFTNNKAVTGGAIGATSIQRLTIINSTFDANLSNGYKSTTGYMNVPEGAGALRVDRTVKPLEIYGSNFTGNSANVKVSVMEVFAAPVSGFSPGMPSNEPTLIVDNCEFKNNKYNNYAGVTNFERAFFAGCVVFHGNSATMKLTNSVFDNNDVGQANVRLINNFEFSNCIFANTNFLTTSNAPQQGAVFLQNIPQSGSFNNCTFYKNEPRNGAVANDIMFWAGNIPSRVSLNNSIFYRENTTTNIKQVKEPLMGNGNNQYIPTVNMSSFAEVSTSTSNKTNPNISPNAIIDMCLGTNSLPDNIGGLADCNGTPPPPPPPTNTSVSIPGTIQVEDFVAKNGSVAAENTPGTNGGQNLGNIQNGNYTEYTIDVTNAGTYQLAAFVSSNGVGGNIVVSVGGTNLATLVVPVNNAWHTYNNPVNGNVNLAAGEQTIRFTYTGPSGFLFNFERAEFSTSTTPPPPPPPSTAIAIPGTIEVENFTAKNGSVAAENTPGTNGGQNLGHIQNGNYTEYTIDVTNAGTYQLTAFVSSNGMGGNIVVSVGGTNLATLVVPVNNAWHTYNNPVNGNVNLAAGEQTIRFTYTGPSGFLFNFERAEFSTSTTPPPPPPPSTAIAIPGTIEVENFTAKNGSVAAENTPGTNGGQNLGHIRNGNYTEYTINVANAGTYQLTAFVSSNGMGGNIVVSVGGTNLATLAVPVNNAWHTYNNPVSGNIDLAAGEQTIRFTYTGPSGFLFNFERAEVTTSTSNPPSSCSVPWNGPNQSITKQTLNWASQDIDISCAASVDISMDVEGLTPALMESSDYLNIFYAIDGGAEIAISQDTDGFALKTISATNVTGNTLKIFVRGATSWQNETYNVTNMKVTSNGSRSNNSNNLVNNKQVVLYPNPATNELNVTFDNFNSTTIELTIADLMGVVIDRKKIPANLRGTTAYRLDTSVLRNGLYLVKIQDVMGKDSIVKYFAVKK